jgi:hypothetical protein
MVDLIRANQASHLLQRLNDKRCAAIRITECELNPIPMDGPALLRLRFETVPNFPYFSIQSMHFATEPLPHGIIGTDDVEFFGDPSMSRSLYTM